MKNADDISVKMGGSLEELSPNAKARLLQILSDPEPGNPWKLDVPVSFPDESLYPIPGNYWARGNLIEIIQYKRIYKPLGYKHHPNVKAYGYYDDGLAWVRNKSVANPNTNHALQKMKKAMDDLDDIAGNDDPMILHVITKDLDTSLKSDLETYRDEVLEIPEIRFRIIVEQKNYP